MKDIKMVRGWSLGVLALVGLIAGVAMWKTEGPLNLTVIGRTNDTFGSDVVVVVISNRTQRTCTGYAMCQSLVDREWVNRLSVNPRTGLPGGEDFAVGPGQSAVSALPSPVSGGHWRVAVIRTRDPGRAETFLIKVFAKVRIRYPFALEVGQFLECKR